jgi:hypothetical protein
MSPTLNDLGATLINQLYDIVCGGDGSIPPSDDTFISWCQPGLPFRAEDFDFAASGFGSGADAEAEKALTAHAFSFAQLVDFIPDVEGAYTNDKQQAMFRPDAESRLSTIYGEILRFAKVVHTELTDDERSQIERMRGLLTSTKKVQDIVTGEMTDVTEDSAMLKAYREKQAAYVAAALLYNSKRVAAQSATGVEGKAAVTDWTNNAELYRMQVKTAMDAWINALGRRDMQLWKQTLVELLDGALVTALGPGQRFYATTLIPGSFATSAGWNGYEVSHETVAAKTHSEKKSWKAGGGVGFGMFKFGGEGGGESSLATSSKEVSTFKLKFELTQAIISRPWFYPEFFQNRGWTLRKGEGWFYDDMPSDGGDPPKGNFIGYPTSALFARGITIESAELAEAYRQESSKLSAGGSVGWGPFSLKGSYSKETADTSFESTADTNVITVPGMQIIGFVNHLLGKTPDPLPDLKEEDFA